MATRSARSSAACITYHHLELDTHDVLLAEGLPCESYLDTGDRASFGSGPVIRLHSEFGRTDLTWESRGYAPLAVAGEAVERVRTALAAHAFDGPQATDLVQGDRPESAGMS